MTMGVKITGIKELQKVFRQLTKSTRRKALRPALLEGAEIIRGMAAANVKSVVSGQSTGVLERSLKVYNYKALRGALRVGVQIKRGLTNKAKVDSTGPVRVGLYGAVLEYGKQGQPPRSWLRKAIREGSQVATDRVRIAAARRMQAAIDEAKV